MANGDGSTDVTQQNVRKLPQNMTIVRSVNGVEANPATGNVDLGGLGANEESSKTAIAGAFGSLSIVGASSCSIPVPDGYPTVEVVHPSVLCFPNGWNGWSYLMAYTPYANTDSTYENPCFAVSNDRVNWVLPSANTPLPVEGKIFGGNYYNSDTALAVDPKDGAIIVVWRWRNDDAVPVKEGLRYTRTFDGVNFEPVKPICEVASNVRLILSPSLMHNGSKWEWYYSDNLGSKEMYRILTDDLLITDVVAQSTQISAQKPNGSIWWHSDIKMTSKPNQRVGLFMEGGALKGADTLWFGVSNDAGLSWSFDKFLASGFGNSYYRSSFVLEPNGMVSVWACYKGILSGRDWGILAVTAIYDGKPILQNAKSAYQSAASGYDPSIKLVDNFNRADSSTSVGTPTIGAYIVSLNTWGISNKQLYAVNQANSRLLVESGTQDHAISFQLENATLTGNQEFWAWCRCTDTANFIRIGTKGTPTGQGIYAQVFVGGSMVREYNSKFSIGVGSFIEVKAKGETISIYVDGHLCLSFIESANKTNTKVGIQIIDNTARVSQLMVRSI